RTDRPDRHRRRRHGHRHADGRLRGRPMTAALRPQQVRLLDELRAVVNAKSVSHLRTMVAAPTGFGKTIVASTLAHEIQAAGKRAIFTVPALSIDQTVEKFYAEGVRDVGVIQAMHPLTNYARPIQIAS